MTPDDAGKVLTLIAVYDNRSFEKVTAHAWANALDGLDVVDCLDAVKAHFRRSRQWLMPADLREMVRSRIVERRRLNAEQSERLAIEQANNNPAIVTERAEQIRRLAAAACKIPPEPSPHPVQNTHRNRQARKVGCPWCEVPAKAPCVNTATSRPTDVTHESRLVAAGLAVVPNGAGKENQP